MTNPPSPRHQAPDAVPLRLDVVAQLRDAQLDICGPMSITFTYDPRDPYALHLRMYEPWNPALAREWTASREMFAVAALWGVEMQSLDISVSPIVVTRATPGQPVRDVPCLRITLREADERGDHHVFTGRDVHLDVVRSDVTQWFTTITQVVRIGQEHRYLDIDALIADILGPSYKEES